jgi:hypothetical protein
VAGEGGDGGVWEERRPTTRGGAPWRRSRGGRAEERERLCGGERGGHGIKKHGRQICQWVFGIEYEIWMTSVDESNIKERISTTRQRYSLLKDDMKYDECW